ncbi:MAG: hypothetical protein J5752_11930 [Clostridiales bacterium]|nr:hypothetical protein [Clostridiales bacterium]
MKKTSKVRIVILVITFILALTGLGLVIADMFTGANLLKPGLALIIFAQIVSILMRAFGAKEESKN